MSVFRLTPEQRQQIEEILTYPESRSTGSLHRRARAVLLYDQGKGTREVALEIGLSRSRARYWRRQFVARGMSIFYAVQNHAPGSVVPSIPMPYMASEPVPEDESLLEIAFEAALGNQEPRLPLPGPLPSMGIKPQDSIAEAGRKTMLFHFAEMLSHQAGACRGEDIEELHDMRVATRRLRAAFDIFGEAFTTKAIRSHLKGLRLVGRTLGRVRDLDVFIEKAQRYLEGLPAEQRAGLDPLLESWRQERQAARTAMLEYLNGEAYQTFVQKFNVLVQTPGKGVRQAQENGLASGRVCEVAPVLIYTRLASVRAYESALENATLDQLHALRIECKKLRYALEFFREVLGEEVRPVIGVMKNIQDHLGDLNDARVACGLLSEFLANWESRQANLPLASRQSPEAIVAYLAAKHAELHHLMVTFPETWIKFNSLAFRKNLALAIAAL